jgi:hypothetical protein
VSARTITITPDGSVVILRGYRVAQLARQAGLRPTFAGSVGGWMVDAHRLSDLVAWLDYRHVAYELEPTDVSVGSTTSSSDVVDVSSLEGLW